MTESADHVLRAMTDDGAFRVIAARTTSTVRGALEAQQAEGRTARHLADLLTGVVLLRETMSPQLRVQGILKGANRTGTLVADSRPTGQTRGLVTVPKHGPSQLDLGQGAVLQLMRTLHDGRLHQGIVEVPRSASGGISEALMVYMQVSEQITTMIEVCTLVDPAEGVTSAGGYLVQLLPEAPREPLAAMTERLEEFEGIDRRLDRPDYSPDRLLDELLEAMPFSRLGYSGVRFECWCSHLSVMSTLATLPRSDVRELVEDGEVLEINCDYCGAEYRVAPAELKGLLDES